MPMNAPIVSYDPVPLRPLYPKKLLKQHVNLLPNTVFPKGRLLGLITTGTVNDVQTATISGAPTGGTFTLGGTNPLNGQVFTTSALAYNAASATVQAALTGATAYGANNVTVTGSAGGPYTITGAGALAGIPLAPLTTTAAFTGGTTPAIAVVHTTPGETASTYGPYASGGANGLGVPVCAVEYACATDAAGNIFYGPTAGQSEWGTFEFSVDCYFSGYFRSQDLAGLDANALTVAGTALRLVSGTITNGVIEII